ncbi:MAG: hypothetical protein ABIB43_02060 [archaeon]
MGIGKLEIILSVIMGSSAVAYAQTTTDTEKVQDDPAKTEQVVETKVEDAAESSIVNYTLSGKLFRMTEEHLRAIQSSYDLNKELNVTLRKFLIVHKYTIANNDKEGNPMVDMKDLLRNKTNIYQPILVNQLTNSFCDVDCAESIIALNGLAVVDGMPTKEYTQEHHNLLVETGTLNHLNNNWNLLFNMDDEKYFFDEIKKGRLYANELDNFLWTDSLYGMHMLTLDPEIRRPASEAVSIYANWRHFRNLPEEDKILDYNLMPNYHLKPKP